MTPDANAIVECQTCYRQKDVDFGACLRRGWPTCHGETMTLVSTPSYAEINKAVSGIVGEAVRTIKNFEKRVRA